MEQPCLHIPQNIEFYFNLTRSGGGEENLEILHSYYRQYLYYNLYKNGIFRDRGVSQRSYDNNLFMCKYVAVGGAVLVMS